MIVAIFEYLHPSQFINELYPYFMKVTIVFITLFILLIIIIFLNIRVIYYKSE